MGISDLLNSTGAPSFSFETLGASVTGTILSADVVQKRNFDTMEPEFWNNDGKPVQQVRVTIETTLREPTEDGTPDDGHRSVYVRGWGDSLRALKAAIAAAGDTDLHPGGTFTATFSGEIPVPAGKRGFPTKTYTFAYTKPSATAGLLKDPASAAAPSWATQIATAPPAPVAPVAPVAPPAPPTWEAFQAAQAAAAAPAPVAPPAPVLPPGVDPEMAAKFAAWTASQTPGA